MVAAPVYTNTHAHTRYGVCVVLVGVGLHVGCNYTNLSFHAQSLCPCVSCKWHVFSWARLVMYKVAIHKFGGLGGKAFQLCVGRR